MKLNSLRILILSILLCCSPKISKAQLVGIVTDTSWAPIPNVKLFDKSGITLSQTRLDGFFGLTLRTGTYKIIFSHPDFYPQEIPIIVQGNYKDTLKIVLTPKTERIETLVINKEWKDPGPGYMRQAILMRDSWSKRIPATSSVVYTKAYEESKTIFNSKKQKPTGSLDSLLNSLSTTHQIADSGTETLANKKIISPDTSKTIDSTTNTFSLKHIANTTKDYDRITDTQRISAFMEILMIRDQAYPNKLKEVRQGVRKIGSKSFLFYLTASDGDFNPYQNLFQVPALCPLPVMSPLSNSALLAYKFQYKGSYEHPKWGRVLRIHMQGRQTANATVDGELELVENGFWILKSSFDFPKHLMAEYDEMKIVQYFDKTEQNWIISDSMRFYYSAKFGKTTLSATTAVDVKSRTINPQWKKNHFGLEISKTIDSAYLRDSSFWEKQRSSPLSYGQARAIAVNDSLQRVYTSDKYLDSVEKSINTVNFKSLVLEGQGYKNRKKGLEMSFQPLWTVYQPWWPGGTRISMFSRIDKTFENKRSISVSENISYGLRNQDLRGTVYLSTLYNPYKRASFTVSGGRDFGVINGNAAYIDMFRRDNFYVHNHVTAYHNQELINGLFLRLQGEYSSREDMSKYQFDEFGDSLFENNKPSVFNNNTAFYATINLSYTPFQRYISEPKQKVILGSSWPTFGIRFKKALPGVLGSTIDYSYLEYYLNHDFPIGLFGTSEIKANSGSFLNYRNISLIDYRYQRRGDATIFTPPLYAFQQLDSTFFTFKRFVEVHYQHRFNGALVNKIPLIKKLSLSERAGVNILYAPERRNMFFYEGYAGIDKLIRVWRDRYKIGIYYTAGYSNLFEKPRYGFKINFEYYDRYNNKW